MMITGMLTLQHIEMVKYVSNHIYQMLYDYKLLHCDFEWRFSSFKNCFKLSIVKKHQCFINNDSLVDMIFGLAKRAGKAPYKYLMIETQKSAS